MKLFAQSVERYYGGVAEKRRYGGTGAVTVFLVGEEGSDAKAWYRITGHGASPSARKADALRQFREKKFSPRDFRNQAPLGRARTSRGRGLGSTRDEHYSLLTSNLVEARRQLQRAQELAGQGSCEAAIRHLTEGSTYLGVAGGHGLSITQPASRALQAAVSLQQAAQSRVIKACRR